MPIAEIQTIPEVFNVLKVLIIGLLAFLLAFSLTPVWTHILFKYKIGIKIKTTGVAGDKLTYVSQLHATKDTDDGRSDRLVFGACARIAFPLAISSPVGMVWVGLIGSNGFLRA